jgi:hypothetical protein
LDAQMHKLHVYSNGCELHVYSNGCGKWGPLWTAFLHTRDDLVTRQLACNVYISKTGERLCSTFSSLTRPKTVCGRGTRLSRQSPLHLHRRGRAFARCRRPGHWSRRGRPAAAACMEASKNFVDPPDSEQLDAVLHAVPDTCPTPMLYPAQSLPPARGTRGWFMC